MKALQKFRRFIVFSNLFISLCAALLTAETLFLFRFPVSYHLFDLFVFSGTLFVYSLHYLLKKDLAVPDERQTWRKGNRQLFRYILFFSFSGVILTSLLLFQEIPNKSLATRTGILFILALIGLFSVFYSHPTRLLGNKSLRRFGKFKLLYLSLIWTVTTGLIPLLFRENDLKIDYLHIIVFAVHRLIFIGSIAFLFNIYDYDEDKESGTNTFAVSWGQKRSLNIGKWSFLMLNLAASALFILFAGNITTIFTIAVLIPSVSVFFLYENFDPAEHESSFVLRHDGLIFIKALLLIFASIMSKY